RRDLTQSVRRVPASQELLDSLTEDAKILPLPAERLSRYSLEPYALKLVYIYRKLAATQQHLAALTDYHAEGITFEAQPPAYTHVDQFIRDIGILQTSLRDNNAGLIADEGSVPHLLIQARTFGFQLAALDVRQHSDEHAKLLDELFAEAGVLSAGKLYSGLPE